GHTAAALEMGEAESAARTVGLHGVRLEIRRAQDIARDFEALKGRAEALYVPTDPTLTSNHGRIITLANRPRLPLLATQRARIDAVSLMSYGPNHQNVVRPRRRLCGQNSARGEAWRHSGCAAEQVRSRPQSDRRQGGRPRNLAKAARARRRGDRVRWRSVIVT